MSRALLRSWVHTGLKRRLAAWIVLLTAASPADADVMGLAQLRVFDPTLTGSGVPVAQVEASETGSQSPSQFEVRPAVVNQPASLFTYISAAGTVSGTAPPNAAGTESNHANAVGLNFYANSSSGVAPGVSHVDNYDALYFINTLIGAATPPPIQGRVVNQSFVITDKSGQPIQSAAADQAYDNYAAQYNTIFVSAAGNSGKPDSPSTAYNHISVGASNAGASTSIGPTMDGRSKPDISAAADETSFAAPFVSGAAVILLQAGARGDGGAGTGAMATDQRTIKALLLNGAVKPTGWSHNATTPLDPHYGSGELNIYHSYQQLQGGRQAFTVSTSTAILGGAHGPPAGQPGNVPSPLGWDFNSLTGSAVADRVNHYFFNVVAGGSPYTLTGTLTWNRQMNQSGINNLDLFLYDVNSGLQVDQSTSAVDNVEHLYTTGLAPGRYDLEVLKHGGVAGTSGVVSDTENYGLAFSLTGVPEPGSVLWMAGAIAALMRRRRSA